MILQWEHYLIGAIGLSTYGTPAILNKDIINKHQNMLPIFPRCRPPPQPTKTFSAPRPVKITHISSYFYIHQKFASYLRSYRSKRTMLNIFKIIAQLKTCFKENTRHHHKRQQKLMGAHAGSHIFEMRLRRTTRQQNLMGEIGTTTVKRLIVLIQHTEHVKIYDMSNGLWPVRSRRVTSGLEWVRCQAIEKTLSALLGPKTLPAFSFVEKTVCSTFPYYKKRQM